jgi:GNAT superfamily N-acetyltransferase
MSEGPVIRQVGGAVDEAGRRRLVDELAAVLIDCVDGGASASFMAPLEVERARAYWSGVLDGTAAGSRVLLVAADGDGTVVGTVQVVPAAEENQPHRGDITKLLVHRRARRQGLAGALMVAAEHAAIELGLSLLVLDTASAEAERVYERQGWTRVGVIEGYALWPDGGLCDTTFFSKHLG